MVETPEGERLICHPRGKKSDCVVGDRVRWMPTGSDEGVIEHLEPRRNLLFRQDEWKTKSFAANIDQLLVLVAANPVFSESQLARALDRRRERRHRAHGSCSTRPTCRSSRLRASAWRPTPRWASGVIETAMKADPAGRTLKLGALLAGKATLVLGPSGTGKSTLINLLAPGARAQVGEVSQALNSGRHTTTTTQWYWLDDAAHDGADRLARASRSSACGRSRRPELASYMPDLREHASDCRFYNCSHRHEPGCGVRAALERGRDQRVALPHLRASCATS